MSVQMNIPESLILAYKEGNSELLNEIHRVTRIMASRDGVQLASQFINLILDEKTDLNSKKLLLYTIYRHKLQLNTEAIHLLIPFLNGQIDDLVIPVSYILGESINNIEEFIFQEDTQIYGILLTLFHYIEIRRQISENVFQYLCGIIMKPTDVFSFVLSARCITKFVSNQLNSTNYEFFSPLFNFVLQYFLSQSDIINFLPTLSELLPLLSLIPESEEKYKSVTFQLSNLAQICPFPTEKVLPDRTSYSFSTYAISILNMFTYMADESIVQTPFIPICIRLCIASDDEYQMWLNDLEFFVAENICNDIEENTFLREEAAQVLKLYKVKFDQIFPHLSNMFSDPRSEEAAFYIIETYTQTFDSDIDIKIPEPVTNDDPILIGRYLMCCIYTGKQIPEQYIQSNHFAIPLLVSKALSIKNTDNSKLLLNTALGPLSTIAKSITTGIVVDVLSIVNQILLNFVDNYQQIIPEYLLYYKEMWINYVENIDVAFDIGHFISDYIVYPNYCLIIQEIFLPILCEFLFDSNKVISTIQLSSLIFSSLPNKDFVITENLKKFYNCFIQFISQSFISPEIICSIFGISAFFARIGVIDGIEQFFLQYSNNKYKESNIDLRFSDLAIALYLNGTENTKNNVLNLIFYLIQIINTTTVTDRTILFLTFAFIYSIDKQNIDVWLPKNNFSFEILYEILLNGFNTTGLQFDINLYFYLLFSFNVGNEFKVKSYELYLNYLDRNPFNLDNNTFYFSHVNPMVTSHKLYNLSKEQFLNFVIGTFPSEYVIQLQKYLYIT